MENEGSNLFDITPEIFRDGIIIIHWVSVDLRSVRSRRDTYFISAISALAECFKTLRDFFRSCLDLSPYFFYQAFISSLRDLTKIGREIVINSVV